MQPNALAMLLLAGALAAQERPAKPRPVPDLAPPRALEWPLPRARSPQEGAGFTIDASGKKPVLRWFTDTLRSAPLGSSEVDTTRAAACSTLLGDFDGDGTADVLVRGPNGLELLRIDGASIDVEPTASLHLERSAEWLSGAACDWFGDGATALACTGEREIVAHRRLTIPGSSQALLRFSKLDLPVGAAIVGSAGDFDLDGMPDLVVALPERGIVWYRNEGTKAEPRFSAAIPLWPSTPGVFVTWIVLAPVDDDPWLDLLVGTAERARDAAAVDFRFRVARNRTPQEDEQLHAIELKLVEAPRLEIKPGLPTGSELVMEGTPFLRGRKQLQDRRKELLWDEIPVTARPPVVHLRVRRG